MASSIENVGEKDIEKGLVSLPPSQNLISEPLPSSNFGKQVKKKKFVKQMISGHNDMELHLAAQQGDLAAVKQILDNIHSQIFGTVSGVEFDAQVAEIRASMMTKVNELGETAVFTAADHGHLDVVKELLKYSSKESLSFKNRSGLDPLHAAARAGHHAIVQVLLEHDPSLSMTTDPKNATALVSAAQKGHTAVVNELLSNNSYLLVIAKSDGKTALHLAARQGHVDIVKALLDKDPQLARRTDKKGQTALHMAVKGSSCKVVKLLLEADPAIVMLPDKFGNTALHVATRKKQTKFLNELLQLPDVGVNALTRDHKTTLDIAEELPLSEESEEIKRCLTRYGARRANALNFPWEELRVVMNELRELHREGTNNTTNSTAVLFATIAFAAIFTVPGGVQDDGVAVVASRTSFKIFFIFNAVSLFTSLAVVVVHNTFVRGETKVHKRVVEGINKLMWLASVSTSITFMAASYIVVGRRCEWSAILVTVVGAMIMAGVIGTMTYYVVTGKVKKD